VNEKNEPLMIGKFIVGKFHVTNPVFITNFFHRKNEGKGYFRKSEARNASADRRKSGN